MLVSLTAASIFPFRLFLLTYAVLGPIHYLTEIHWLRERNYFVTNKKWIWLYSIVTVLISIPVILFLPFLSDFKTLPFIAFFMEKMRFHSDTILLTIFLFSIGLVQFKKIKHLLAFLILSVIISKLITKYLLFSTFAVNLFLPTIIHVYLFTMIFMMAGVIRSKSKVGLTSIIILIIIPIIIYLFPLNPFFYLNLEGAEVMSTVRNFRFISFLGKYFDIMKDGQFVPLTVGAVKLQIFIAFSYTYHYLNWFSKTSLIGWHKNLSKPKMAIIIIIWLALVALSFYDYEIGYLVLYGLALLHIVFEFPLNISSIKEVFGHVTRANRK